MLKHLVLLISWLPGIVLAAQQLLPPENPEQTLAYWKPYIVSSNKNDSVEKAHQVFDDLLKSWDNTRIEPVLHVVNSHSGPWAASLLDGTVLLSESAIEACQHIGGSRYPHLLAFILAHELAHQRSDDLWHFKFFRLVGVQHPQLQKKMLNGFGINQEKLQQIEKQEAQADQDGLTLMAMMGYDPLAIVSTTEASTKNFFTAWVENIWNKPCQLIDQHLVLDISQACEKAEVRAARARAHLKKIALESGLYQLGLEAFVAGNFKKSRNYFKAYGRIYPGHVVHNNIGMTWLAEVMQLNQKISKRDGHRVPEFIYPVVLDLEPVAFLQKRGINKTKLSSLIQQREKAASHAVSVFEKAIKLAPDYRPAYINLMVSYLLNDNTPMARGIMLGKYKKKFGTDIDFDLLMLMTAVLDGNEIDSEDFNALVKKVLARPDEFSAQQIYSVVQNTAQYLHYQQRPEKLNHFWKSVADKAKSMKDPSLFRLAVAALQNNRVEITGRHDALKNLRQQINQKISQYSLNKTAEFFWFEGEKIYHTQLAGNRFLFDEQGKRLSMVVSPDSAIKLAGIDYNDDAMRIFIQYGIPDRRIYLLNGEYIAYDDAGIAVYIKSKKVQSWFIY